MPRAKHQFEDFLMTVEDDHKKFVTTIHEMMLQDGYKLKVQETKSYGLHISYSQPKIKVVKGIILYLLIREGKLMIRINMDGHAKYTDVFNRLPERMVSQIDKMDDCKKLIDPTACWNGCGGHDLYIAGKHYKKCICSFRFDVDSESMPYLFELIQSETKERCTI